MSATASKSAGSRGPLSRDDWVAAATHVLAQKSIDAVRVDALSRQLNVTRGSFYWHFRSRTELLDAILTAWRNAATEQVIDRFERRRTSPEEQIRDLLSLPFRGPSARRAADTELAIRAWARRDAMARKVVDEVDATRLSYIAQCFTALGLELAEARLRAFTLYGYEVAESLLAAQGSDRQKRERRAFMEWILLNTPAGRAGGAD
ncbi:TetR/AcrR family transcriptional regulator [Verticiella sediminum]|uniref:TetR/AcrR family transcriptional regulator n=1 Tax=Verticiella sediminum TaxID=1247510 RepID=A0A556AKE1_9BURK|nr:TetR/AcrR family transcriptional regulator [Verticiella sediminum]TSH93346.1 TetR/AcrR family transcriptional regulator [Verticiella sediminum]